MGSFAGLDALLGQLEQSLELNRAFVVKGMTDLTVETAKQEALQYGAYDSGELYNGIFAEYRDGNGYARSTAEHTAYVEFGTGVVGANSLQHPQPVTSAGTWQHDVNNHGEKGWTYYDETGEHWTMGMPPRPFLYDTVQLMKSEGTAASVAKKVWRKL